MLLSWLRPKPSARRRVFVSYHHADDQTAYREFAQLFAHRFEAVRDRSIDREVDSDDPYYVMRRIREKYIHGTSCMIVLCGAKTPWRKYVDWEIKAALDMGHGMIGVNLPSNTARRGGVMVPARLYDNIRSGYALWIQWSDLNRGPSGLRDLIEEARGKPHRLIVNDRPMLKRNGRVGPLA